MSTLSVPERCTVNGVDMICPAWSLDPSKGRKGLAMTPALRDLSVSVPGRRGVLTAPGVAYDAGVFVLNLWVLGVDPGTGLVPEWSSTEDQLSANIGTLAAVFHSPTLAIEWARRDGSVRRAAGTLSQPLDPAWDAITRPAYAELAVAIRIDDAFWFDAAPVAAVFTAVSDAPVSLWEFDGAEAPLDDLTYVIGPAWNPILADAGGTGTWLAYDAVIPDGQALIYDGASQQVTGGGGLVVDQGRVRRGRRLTLAPGNPPALSVSSSGPNPVNVQVSGRRAFLTA